MSITIPPPQKRVLRGYAVDPSLAVSLSTLPIHELRYEVDWEELTPRSSLSPAPRTRRRGSLRSPEETGSYPQGEYLEIIDYDPATGVFYEPVNLDDPHLLAQGGHKPDVGNPQFHQQMVYAVMMTTIRNFERALGRRILWAEQIPHNDRPQKPSRATRPPLQFGFVQRLRVYPHALRQANAFYDPERKALLFGYFNANPADPGLQLPGSTVFTCLSHDIIAHETTHAILDGLHRRYIFATHPDTRAFHEAFADIVALFQHFTFPEVLRHQIALTRGDLQQQNLLGQLAQEFGRATGGYGGLRDAIGGFDQNGEWKPKSPSIDDYRTQKEFHARGSILVAAVFEAFVNVYRERIRKVLRIATNGTGNLPQGELLPDLVDELARVAADTAATVLRICIRALDYCPPVDLTFGDYLRALITADSDMVDNDQYGYRVAFVEAFQKRGISVAGINTMAVESLRHPLHVTDSLAHNELMEERHRLLAKFLREVKSQIAYAKSRKELYDNTLDVINGIDPTDTDKRASSPKAEPLRHRGLNKSLNELLKSFLTKNDSGSEKLRELTGLMFPGSAKDTSSEAIEEACRRNGLEFGYLTEDCASYVIDKVWLANRAAPDGRILDHVIVTLVQKRGVFFEMDTLTDTWKIKGYFVDDHTPPKQRPENSIIFRGGCTLIFDLEKQQLRYAIKKDIDDKARMLRQFLYEREQQEAGEETYFTSNTLANLSGPFAFMHSHHPAGEHSHD